MNPSTQRQASLAFVLLLMVGCFHFLDFLPSPGLLDAVATKTKENNEVLITPLNSTDEKQSLIPKWISTYGKWHTRQRLQFDRDGDEQVKFMIVVCLRETRCGGISDRIRPLPYWVVLAEQTDRVLLIHWNKKFALEDFWIPPQSGWDWTIPESFLSRDPFRSSCLHQSNKIVREFYDHANHEHVMNTLRGSERVVCVLTNSDATSLVADIAYNSSDYAIAQVFGRLFTPSESLQEFIDDNLHQMGMQLGQPFLAVHVRAKYPLNSESGKVFVSWEEHSTLMKTWANNAVDQVILAYQQHFPNSKVPPVYVASDLLEVVQYLESNSSFSVLALDDSLPRHHIEFAKGNLSKVDMFPPFFDLWMLSHSDCFSYGIGGYGRLGARLGGLGCTVQHRSSREWEDYQI